LAAGNTRASRNPDTGDLVVIKKVKKLIHLSDLHIPDHDERSVRNVLRYVRDAKPDVVLLNGDILDMALISSHNKGNLRAIEGRFIRQEYDRGERFLDDLQKAAGGASVIWVEGNHEYRVERWLNEYPQLRGVMEIPRQLNLGPRGIRWVPSWSRTEIISAGKANFVHGLYSGMHHARKMVDAFESNIFYGHTHDVQCHAKIAVGDDNTKIAHSLGCLCNYQQSYLKGRPTNWQQAFAVFHFRNDGYFNYFVPLIFGHKFISPEGEWYG
jgi:predicted phosphodiesterase